MKKGIKNSLVLGRKFKREFKRQLRLLVTFTLGFTIAFTWRQTIFDISQSFVQFIFHLESNSTSSILTSIFITFTSIILIYFISYHLKDSYEDDQY